MNPRMATEYEQKVRVALAWALEAGYIAEPLPEHQRREFAEWVMMLSRCYNPDDPGYASEGGRGIAVHDAWNPARGGSFANFYRDMGPMPADDESDSADGDEEESDPLTSER